MLVRYAVLANEALSIHDLAGRLETVVGQQGREVAMTEGERLIEQGRLQGEAKGRAEGEAKGRAEGEAKGRAEGEAKGRVAALLALFAARGLVVSPELRGRIESCKDLAMLDRWIARAITAHSAAEAISEA